MHRTHVDTHPRGYGRYAYSWVCTCGKKGGTSSNQAEVQKAARKHERNPR